MAIVREFIEEFGIAVEVIDTFQTFTYTTHDVHMVGICFLLSFDGDAAVIRADGIENDEIAWATANNLAEYFEANDHNYAVLAQYFTNKS